MTNEQIIFNNSVFLMEQGLLKGTGEKVMFMDEQGEREVEVPEEIHTFNEWKRMGFMVKKGEHAIAKFPIWQLAGKGRKKKDDEAGEEDAEKKTGGRFYMKVAFFFTREQVKELAKQ